LEYLTNQVLLCMLVRYIFQIETFHEIPHHDKPLLLANASILLDPMQKVSHNECTQVFFGEKVEKQLEQTRTSILSYFMCSEPKYIAYIIL